MKSGSKILVWIAGCVVVATTAQAVTDGSNPYERIIERNVFSLKPPPKPEDLLPPPTPAPKITLQGITSILGRRQVLFKIVPSKPGDKEQSYILSEGQREDDVEVLSIDVDGGSIKFNNHGDVQTLTMDKDASKPSTVASAAPAGIPRPMPAGMPAPAMGRMPGAPAMAAGGTTTIGGGQQGLRQIPTRNVRTPMSANASAGYSQPVQPSLSHEESTILIEVERERTRAQVEAGDLPPPPITELTPPGAVGTPQEVPAPSPSQ